MKTEHKTSMGFRNALFLMAIVSALHLAHGQSWTNQYSGTFLGPLRISTGVEDGVCAALVLNEPLGNPDIATIKYSGAGVPLWVSRYDGPGKGSDAPSVIAVDLSGNIIVTGTSADPGDANKDYATIKYSSAGVALWTNRFDRAQHDEPGSMAVDSKGNVVIAGISTVFNGGNPTSDTMVTISYSSDGVPLWTNYFPGGLIVAQVATDESNNVVVAGSVAASVLPWQHRDYVTIKYSAAGVPLWTNHYSASEVSQDTASALALDATGNIFVTGDTHEIGFDWVTVAYSSEGTPLWTNRYSGAAGGDQTGRDLAVDPEGNIIVAGNSWTESARDYIMLKYSGAGALLWTISYDGSADGYNSLSQMALDRRGNIFVTGHSFNGADQDYVTLAYSSSGLPLWTNRYDAGNDFPEAIAVDPTGNVYVAGYRWTGDSFEHTLIKYGAQGSPVRLEVQHLHGQVVLSWSDASFNLESAADPAGPFMPLTGATSPYTHVVSGHQRFFRLAR